LGKKSQPGALRSSSWSKCSEWQNQEFKEAKAGEMGRFPLTPGKHTIKVSAAGFKDWIRDITLIAAIKVLLGCGLESKLAVANSAR
jgi:hypothetical protein